MYIANVTEIRQNASKIIARLVKSGEPVVILQRSKPVAYVIEASAYEEMLNKLEAAEDLVRRAETKSALQRLASIRQKMARRGRQQDSTPIIRQLREGKIR